jgi:uncharacterized protein YuzE
MDNPVLRAKWDSHADACYISLGDKAQYDGGKCYTIFVKNKKVKGDIILEFSKDNRLIGVEVIGAERVLLPDLLDQADTYE